VSYSVQGHHHYSVVRFGKGPWLFQSEFLRQDDLVLHLSVSRPSTLRSSSSCSRLLLRLPLASIFPSIVSSLPCFRRRFLSTCDQFSYPSCVLLYVGRSLSSLSVPYVCTSPRIGGTRNGHLITHTLPAPLICMDVNACKVKVTSSRAAVGVQTQHLLQL